MSAFRLLCVGHDPKTVKGEKAGYLTGVLYLAPASLSGRNVCSHSSPGCRDVCLNTAGRGQFAQIQSSRVRKTQWFQRDQEGFLTALWADIAALVRKAERMGLVPVVRLNGTSDLPWENLRLNGMNAMQAFPQIQFYDYSKIPTRMQRHAVGELPANYYLLFSRSENNESAVRRVLDTGRNVSVVFNGPLPETWMGRPVINGDLSDLRFLDPSGVVVGLKAKGLAKRSTNGFVVSTN